MQDAGDEPGVLVRARLEVDVGKTRGLGATRIDHDELHAALHRVVELTRRVLADELLRHHRVRAGEEPDVGNL